MNHTHMRDMLLAAAERRARPSPDITAASVQPHTYSVEWKETCRSFFFCLEDCVLDYKRNSAASIEGCLERFKAITENAQRASTEEDADTCVGARSPELVPILHVKGGEKLLLSAGWCHRVHQLERVYVFRKSSEQSVKEKEVATEALRLVDKAIETVRSKNSSENASREKNKQQQLAHRQKVLEDFENDKRERKAAM